MKVATLFLTILPGSLYAHGGHVNVVEPFHTLSHSGHIVGAAIIVVALIVFYRARDES